MTEEMLNEIKAACQRIEYGTVVINLREESSAVDIEITERKRFSKDTSPRPGKVIVRERVRRLDT